jgi:hypothetical protein
MGTNARDPFPSRSKIGRQRRNRKASTYKVGAGAGGGQNCERGMKVGISRNTGGAYEET